MTGRGEAQGTRALRLGAIRDGELFWEATVSELAGREETDGAWKQFEAKRVLTLLRLGLCSGHDSPEYACYCTSCVTTYMYLSS